MSVLMPLSHTRTGRTALLDRLDPRTRIVAAGSVAVAVVGLKGLDVLLLALGLACVLLPLAGLSPERVLRRLLAVNGLVAAALAMLPFTTPGTPLIRFGPLTASFEGVQTATELGLTANTVLIALFALVGGLEPGVVGQALSGLRVPARLTTLLLFTVRYLDVLQGEYSRLRRAMRARAFRSRTAVHTYRSLGHLLGMLLVRSLERSERVLAAMKCRGFNGSLPCLEPLRFGPADAAFAAGTGIVLVFLLVMDHGHAFTAL